MKLEMTGQMRLEQRMKLAPRMIQSMEILQLPILALQERIEQEINNNPVLELDESSDSEESDLSQQLPSRDQDEAELIIDSAAVKAEDFGQIENVSDDYKNYMNQIEPSFRHAYVEEVDRKFEAIKNTAAPSQSLHDYLSDQWRLLDLDKALRKAGEAVID